VRRIGKHCRQSGAGRGVSHFAIHDAALAELRRDGRIRTPDTRITDRFWNEHNFVFLRNDQFFHAKGATPAFANFADDAREVTIIPLNMAELPSA